MDSVVQPSNNRGQVFCSSLPGLEILTTVRHQQNINNTNEPAEVFGQKYCYGSYYDMCLYKRFTYCGKLCICGNFIKSELKKRAQCIYFHLASLLS